eukprot:TRINITY_DN6764_c0_g1_i1.p1 TRINITY_DN6764_c0_g1~~TRINITY_DN6764_c0_g1_i1.p1  ORF type:complete len:1266 (+),score=221.68 TRINITY_DN6764_c0_g1_i1:174-3971(+)
MTSRSVLSMEDRRSIDTISSSSSTRSSMPIESPRHVLSAYGVVPVGADFLTSSMITAVRDGLKGVVAKLLSDYGQLAAEVVDEDLQTPLHLAALDGRIDMIRLLLNFGASVNAKDKNGWTPLHCSAANGHLSTSHRLLGAGADPSAQTDSGTTPLHYFVRVLVEDEKERSLYFQLLNVMLEHKNGCGINCANASGETPLHQACFRGREDAICWLLDNNADVNSQNCYQETPLHFAARTGNKRAVELLLDCCADPSIDGHYGTCEEVALSFNQTHILDVLKEAAYSYSQPPVETSTPNECDDNISDSTSSGVSSGSSSWPLSSNNTFFDASAARGDDLGMSTDVGTFTTLPTTQPSLISSVSSTLISSLPFRSSKKPTVNIPILPAPSPTPYAGSSAKPSLLIPAPDVWQHYSAVHRGLPLRNGPLELPCQQRRIRHIRRVIGRNFHPHVPLNATVEGNMLDFVRFTLHAGSGHLAGPPLYASERVSGTVNPTWKPIDSLGADRTFDTRTYRGMRVCRGACGYSPVHGRGGLWAADATEAAVNRSANGDHDSTNDASSCTCVEDEESFPGSNIVALDAETEVTIRVWSETRLDDNENDSRFRSQLLLELAVSLVDLGYLGPALDDIRLPADTVVLGLVDGYYVCKASMQNLLEHDALQFQRSERIRSEQQALSKKKGGGITKPHALASRYERPFPPRPQLPDPQTPENDVYLNRSLHHNHYSGSDPSQMKAITAGVAVIDRCVVACQQELNIATLEQTKLLQSLNRVSVVHEELRVKKRERDCRRIRVQRLAHMQQEGRNNQERLCNHICSTQDALSTQATQLSEAQLSLVERYAEIRRSLDTMRKERTKLAVMSKSLWNHRQRLLSGLLQIYPIKEFPSPFTNPNEQQQQQIIRHRADSTIQLPSRVVGDTDPFSLSIRGVRLPNSDFTGCDEESIAKALGYVAHFALVLSSWLQVPLRYPMIAMGSRSFIRDEISQATHPIFPLYSRGVERPRFEYAVYILNKNLQQLVNSQGLDVHRLRTTLPNLFALVRHLLAETPSPEIVFPLSGSPATLATMVFPTTLSPSHTASSSVHSSPLPSIDSFTPAPPSTPTTSSSEPSPSAVTAHSSKARSSPPSSPAISPLSSPRTQSPRSAHTIIDTLIERKNDTQNSTDDNAVATVTTNDTNDDANNTASERRKGMSASPLDSPYSAMWQSSVSLVAVAPPVVPDPVLQANGKGKGGKAAAGTTGKSKRAAPLLGRGRTKVQEYRTQNRRKNKQNKADAD